MLEKGGFLTMRGFGGLSGVFCIVIG